jgi:hypothetical protein
MYKCFQSIIVTQVDKFEMKIMNIIVHGVASTLFEFFLFCQFFEIINPLSQKFQKNIKIVKIIFECSQI